MTVKVFILSSGSRGDVQPYLVFGLLLLHNPVYQITMVVPPSFQSWIESHDLAFQPYSDDDPFSDPDKLKRMGELVVRGNDRELLSVFQPSKDSTAATFQHLVEVCTHADLLIGGTTSAFVTACVAEKLKKKHGVVHLIPFTRTNEFPSALIGKLPVSFGWINNLTYTIQTVGMHIVGGDMLNYARKHIGLEPLGMFDFERMLASVPSFCGYSNAVIPRPNDWPAHVSDGCYFLYTTPTEKEWLGEELEAFLQGGPPVVYIGFGSMPVHDRPEFIKFITEIVALSPPGIRYIVHVGKVSPTSSSSPHPAFESLKPRVCAIKSAPHMLLFPRCAMVVHHGGAGTTGTAFAAGAVQMVLSFIADQVYWGQIVSERGCGPLGMPFRKAKVAVVVAKIMEGIMKVGYKECAAKIRDEIKKVEAGELVRGWVEKILALKTPGS
ncbi:hypothetical protein BJ742DRAFT_846218 [Cladochytrium replicatum]|nr:hypothetical protein BJ742DRAFT_846218 [Cladochytrium replicatum]